MINYNCHVTSHKNRSSFQYVAHSPLSPSCPFLLPCRRMNIFFVCSAKTGNWTCGHNAERCHRAIRRRSRSHTYDLIALRISDFLCALSFPKESHCLHLARTKDTVIIPSDRLIKHFSSSQRSGLKDKQQWSTMP